MSYRKQKYDALDRKFNRIFARNHGEEMAQYYCGPVIQTSSMTAAVAENAIQRGANRRTARCGGCE